ncbi:hypothetical protein KKA47_04900 [bacterium]|nr:hypothetical protein [bacterium]
MHMIFLFCLIATPLTYAEDGGINAVSIKDLPELQVQIEGIKDDTLFGVYYNVWTDEIVDEAIGKDGSNKFGAVFVKAGEDELQYISKSQIQRLKENDVKVFCHLSLGEDRTLHKKSYSQNLSGPEIEYASWYYDVDHNGYIDKSHVTYGYYVNVSDEHWQRSIKNFTNKKGENFYGYDYLIYNLGCNGLILDHIDTVMPEEWRGNYSAQINDMFNLIASIRDDIPNNKYIVISGGLFYHLDTLDDSGRGYSNLLRPLINGVFIKNYSDMPADQQFFWKSRLEEESKKDDGFTIFYNTLK